MECTAVVGKIQLYPEDEDESEDEDRGSAPYAVERVVFDNGVLCYPVEVDGGSERA